MTLIPANCALCAFWTWDGQGPDYRVGYTPMPLEFMRGECRRRAPVLTQALGRYPTREWPTTRGDDHCGEWMDVGSRMPRVQDQKDQE